MSALSLPAMQAYLRSSISSLNQNKLNGLLAEISLREYLRSLGFHDRISPGGWITRTKGSDIFGRTTAAFFPETIAPGREYQVNRQLPNPPVGLHAICSKLHETGIQSFYATANVGTDDDVSTASWRAMQLGLPSDQPYQALLDAGVALGFTRRTRRFNFLKYDTETQGIPTDAVPEEFSKEHLRVSFQSDFFSEISDIDGVLWGRQHTYPLEIKEKTVAPSADLGPYFGLDVGPFVKLAFYAAKRGNLHSIFVVREIDNPETRNLVSWLFVTFDHMAQFASWNSRPGGRSMTGGQSSVVRIPKSEFRVLNAGALASL